MTTLVVSAICINMDENYIHEQHTVHHILYHLIFCPKRRKKVLVGPVYDGLKQIIEEVAQENGWQIVQLAIQPDHVHLFIQANPSTLPTDIARLIKGRSSHESPSNLSPFDENAIALDTINVLQHGGLRQPGHSERIY